MRNNSDKLKYYDHNIQEANSTKILSEHTFRY